VLAIGQSGSAWAAGRSFDHIDSFRAEHGSEELSRRSFGPRSPAAQVRARRSGHRRQESQEFDHHPAAGVVDHCGTRKTPPKGYERTLSRQWLLARLRVGRSVNKPPSRGRPCIDRHPGNRPFHGLNRPTHVESHRPTPEAPRGSEGVTLAITPEVFGHHAAGLAAARPRPRRGRSPRARASPARARPCRRDTRRSPAVPTGTTILAVPW